LNEKSSIPELSGSEIIKATGGVLAKGNRDFLFSGLSTDSRQVLPGSLFVPLVGERFDGHDFIADALKGGAAGFLAQRSSRDKIGAGTENAVVIYVDDTLLALGDMAHFWRKKFKASVVAITGSSGKTTTKEMLAAIAGPVKRLVKSEGNYNNLIGLPKTVFRINALHEMAILELGTNTRGEIRRLTTIAEPDIGLITNIGPAHLEGFKSVATVREEKLDLFRNMPGNGIAVINVDDERLKVSGKDWRGTRITFGIRKKADVSAEGIDTKKMVGAAFTIGLNSMSEEITLPTVGIHNIYNALAAAATAAALGIDFATICRGLSEFHPVSGRMEICRLKNGAFIINDTYNANPASFGEALKTLKDLKGKRKSTVIMGDMLELGDQAEAMHEGIGSLMADTGVDNIYLRGRFSGATAAGALEKKFPEGRIIFFEDSDEIMDRLKSHVKKGDWILVKGSRQARMEEVVAKIFEAFGPEEREPKK